MTDEAIAVELRHINRRLEKVEKFVDDYDEKQNVFYEQHCHLCGAWRFFSDEKLRDSLFNAIYEIGKQKEAKKNRDIWIRFAISLPIAGLILERIFKYIQSKQ